MFTPAPARHRARPKTAARRIAVLGIALVLGGVSVGIVAGTAQAVPNTTQYANETFTGAQVTDPTAYRKLSPTSNTANSVNLPCLTAGTNTTQTPIQGCNLSAPDAAGSGALRFTTTATNQASGVGATSAIPLAQGLDATFDSYQYGGSAADGIAFYLAATDPYNPTTPTSTGALGGALGYSTDQATGVAGINDGYLGLGLDQYGNYEKQSFSGSTCTTGTSGSATRSPNVTVRGPGNGTSGYCSLASKELASPMTLDGTARSNADVPVEVAINTNATQTLTTTGISGKLASISVAPLSYAITFLPLGSGATQQTVTGPLPQVRTGDAAYQSGWYDANGYPYKLTYGWTSSTGGMTDNHEVNRFVANSLNGAAPVLVASASSPTTVTYGQTGTYTLQPSVSSTGGDETGRVQVATTFPTGTTPTAGSFTAGAYSCTTAGQSVTCAVTNPTTVAAGSNLPTLRLPFTETLNAGTTGAVITSKVASTDSLQPATASSTVAIAKAPTTTTLTSSENPSAYTDAVTFTATIADPAATGSVVFTDTTTNTVLCTTTTITSGVATCQTNALTAGPHMVTAAYSGDTNRLASSAAPLSQTVDPKPTTLTLVANPAGVEYGTSSSVTASLPVGDEAATGTITFTGDDGESAVGVLEHGSATYTTTATNPVGQVQYTATYSGDANYAGATSNTATVTISRATTTIAATVDQKTSEHVAYGTAATLAATGLPSGATGTVEFRSGDAAQTLLCSAPASAPTCSTSTTLAVGTYPITARYLGDTRYASSQSNTVNLAVDKASPSITATATPATSTYGDAVTLGEGGVPADAADGSTVAYSIDGAAACVATLPATTCAPAATPVVGTHTVVATWDGDANHDAATSPAASFTVTKADTAIGATVDRAPSDTIAHGTSATLAATGIPADATGSSVVTFTTGTGAQQTTLGSGTAADPTATTRPSLMVGTYRIVATWAGDANHTPAASDPVTLTVTQQTTAIAAEVDAAVSATIHHGETARLTAAGLPTDATGTVSYQLADGTVLATGDAASTDAPATTDPSLAAGTYRIVAVYSGDSEHAGTTSDAVQLVVAKRQPVLTDTANGSSSGSTTYGTPATLAVANLPADATGTVEFRDQDGNLLCTATVPGAGTCDTAGSLPAATYRVTATYTGDANDEPAVTSSPATLTVAKAPGSVELGSATGGRSGGSGTGTGTGSGPSSGAPDVVTTFGAPVTLTPTGLPAGAAGVVRFVDAGGATLCSVDLGAGETSCVTALGQAVGDYTVTPEWSGDDDHAAATGTPFALAVSKADTAVTVTAGASTTWGSPTTLTIGGLPANATGTVTLTAGGTTLCTVTLPATSCSTAALQPGTTLVTATYSGDEAYAGSSATTPVVVTASHTVDTTVVHSPSTTSITATWPAVPGATGYTITVSTSKDLGGAPRTVPVSGTGLTAPIGDLRPGTQYWYRVSATAADGTVLGTHDATAVTAALPVAAAAADPAPAALAFTGSTLSIGLIGGGALLLLLAGGLLVAANRLRAAEEVLPGPMRRGV